jgi:hypothetical protein
MKGLSTEELTKESEMVVIGEVKDVQSHWSNDGTTIFSSAAVVVYEIIKGRANHDIVVEYEGGEVGEIGLKVSDVEPLKKGEKVLLFLKTGKSKKDGNIYNIIGKSQGKYTIGEDGIARRGGFTTVSGEEVVDNNIPTEKLIDKIRKVEQ